MSKIQHNISLKPYNTFGIDVNTSQFTKINSLEELILLLKQNNKHLLILGGGSNILFTKDFDGLAIKNNIKGIKRIAENDEKIYLKVGAGENWHQFVLYCINHNYCGIENLSLIPGNVGASPMQNIGAYGVEVKDVITKVEALRLSDYQIVEFTNEQCQFEYRSSIFKTKNKGEFIITAVYFELSKKPQLNISYGAIENELKNKSITQPTIKEVSDVVISIRKSKLPDPKEIGNSGSFFKNPVVSEKIKLSLIEKYPDIPNYPQKDGRYKIAAGWLIEKCGWKGKRINQYGVYDKQALVLVNYGGAEGKDIFQLSEDIITSVKEKFGITLEREVNIF